VLCSEDATAAPAVTPATTRTVTEVTLGKNTPRKQFRLTTANNTGALAQTAPYTVTTKAGIRGKDEMVARLNGMETKFLVVDQPVPSG